MPEYDLEPIPSSAPEPVVQAPHPCSGCGYNLIGLPVSGKCPECARLVEVSLKGQLLRYASHAYVRSIDLGLMLVLSAVLAYALLFVSTILIGAFISSGSNATAAKLVTGGLMLVPSVLFIFGYWKYTEPDPGFTGREKPTSARNIARAAACVIFALDLASFVLELAAPTTGVNSIALVVGGMLFMLIRFGVWATLFFAVVLYTQWLARRVPDHGIIATTRVYLWLLPVLTTVGALACMIGPVIAFILYATLLNSMRQRTHETLDWQERGGRHVFGA